MKEKIVHLSKFVNEKLDTRLKKTAALVIVMAFIILPFLPDNKPVAAYTRVATKACETLEQLEYCTDANVEIGLDKSNRFDCSRVCKSYKMLDKIIVYKSDSPYWQIKDIYNDYLYINPSDVVFENTPEYEQTKQENENYKAHEENQKKETCKKHLSKIEPKIKKVFAYTNVRSELYYCYIKPDIWNNLAMPEKKQAFIMCSEYGKYKNNNPYEEASKMQIKTTIKSASSEENLAEYSITKGIIIIK